MRQWWQARSASERRMLGLGMVAVGAALYYLLALEPLLLARERIETRLAAERALGAELSALTAEAARLRLRGDTRRLFDADGSLLAVVNVSAARAGTQRATKRMTPLGASGVTLFLDDVAFADLATWLVALDVEYGVEVERAALDSVRPGVVDAQLTLRARGLSDR
jgi:general secretion pathway protein M